MIEFRDFQDIQSKPFALVYLMCVSIPFIYFSQYISAYPTVAVTKHYPPIQQRQAMIFFYLNY